MIKLKAKKFVCSKCKENKPYFKFGTKRNRRGEIVRHPQCLACVRAYKASWARCEKGLKTRAEWKASNQDKMLNYHKQYYRENKEELVLAEKLRASTIEGKSIRQKASKRYWDAPANKLKTKARSIVNHALRDGKITKPIHCEDCKQHSSNLEAHHEDYSKPLQVAWLCKECHENRHHLNEGQLSNE